MFWLTENVGVSKKRNVINLLPTVEVDFCGYRRMDGEGLLCVWGDADGSAFIQVLGTHSVVHQRQLASCGAKSATVAGKVGTNGKGIVERKGG